MRREELFTDPTFLRLPETQQKFVRALVESGNDKCKAAHATWNCKDDASAVAMANRALRKVGVRKLVDAFYGIDVRDLIPTPEEITAEAWRRFQGAKDGNEAYKWLTLVSRYHEKAAAAPPPPTAEAEDELMAALEQRIDPTGSETEL